MRQHGAFWVPEMETDGPQQGKVESLPRNKGSSPAWKQGTPSVLGDSQEQSSRRTEPQIAWSVLTASPAGPCPGSSPLWLPTSSPCLQGATVLKAVTWPSVPPLWEGPQTPHEDIQTSSPAYIPEPAALCEGSAQAWARRQAARSPCWPEGDLSSFGPRLASRPPGSPTGLSAGLLALGRCFSPLCELSHQLHYPLTPTPQS